MADSRQYTEILRSVSKEKFHEILNASARKSRETYFARHGIKAPKKAGAGFQKPGAKNEARAHGLYSALLEMTDDELSEEILRVYLLGKRDMLAAALDHLGIEHQNGLTESDDVEKFEGLKGKDLKQLVAHIGEAAGSDDVALYLKYMGTDASEVDRALS
ncbi:MAG: hypothetical protein AAFQ82_01560 [Myxococcota bacterium]